jgi:hypothetical protein
MTVPFPAGKRLVAYLRDSGGERQELSIPQQEEKLAAWCRDKGVLIRGFVNCITASKRPRQAIVGEVVYRLPGVQGVDQVFTVPL